MCCCCCCCFWVRHSPAETLRMHFDFIWAVLPSVGRFAWGFYHQTGPSSQWGSAAAAPPPAPRSYKTVLVVKNCCFKHFIEFATKRRDLTSSIQLHIFYIPSLTTWFLWPSEFRVSLSPTLDHVYLKIFFSMLGRFININLPGIFGVESTVAQTHNCAAFGKTLLSHSCSTASGRLETPRIICELLLFLIYRGHSFHRKWL